MNKDKLQVGDLVIHPGMDYRQIALYHRGVGLVIDVGGAKDWCRVYWFRSGKSFRYLSWNLDKLSPTQEKENE
tara:strand:+ start:35 stop:253 length:219 start_codon:yes stop_codon:yes gene_type:complete